MRVFVPQGACGAGAHGGSACARGIGGRGGRVAVRHVQIESVINSLVNKIILKRKKKNLQNLKTHCISSPCVSRAPVRGVDDDGEDGGDGGDIDILNVIGNFFKRQYCSHILLYFSFLLIYNIV